MNPVFELLRELRARRVNISAVGNDLVCEAPPGVLTPDLRERMSASKPMILRLLANPNVTEDVADGDVPPALGLSRAQSSIWLLEQINPGTSVWNVSWALDVRGELDRGALTTSFRAVLQRHAALRSRFRNVDGTPVVEHLPLGDWSVDHVDLSAIPDAEARGAALAKAEVQRPFDLERGPLCRVKLLQTAKAAYVLVLVVHHIVADGWSLGLIGLELSRVYQACLRGSAKLLPPLRTDYQTFVRRARDEEAATHADLDWWREKLSGELPIISLAADNTRPPTGAGRRISINLGRDLTTRIDAMAKEHRATPFMVMLAAFKLLMHRYTGLSDLLIGAHVSGRDRPEFADVIGMFVNTVVLRTAVTHDLTAAELLSRVREGSLEAFARQHVAFDRVVETVKPRRISGHNPLVRHVIAYQNLPPIKFQLGSAELTHKPLELAGARYELSIEIWRTQDGMLCDFEYATNLFDEPTIRRMMGHYQKILAEIAANPERRIFDLPLMPDAEREQLLTAWNDTATDYPVERRIDEWFAQQVERTPDAPALICRGREMSYRELDQHANRLAHYLCSLGVAPGSLIGVCLERSPDLVTAILAVLKAGGAFVPLDPKYPQQRLAFMLEDSAAAMLITDSSLRGIFAYPGHMIEIDMVQATIAEQPHTTPANHATAENLAYVIYTSGSTGRPKGTMLRHSAGYLVDWARRSFAPEDLTRVVAGTSVCFDLSMFEIFVPLCLGGAIILVADPLDLPDPADRPTMLNTVPSVLAELVRARAIPDSVRTIIACGEKLNNAVVQGLYECAKVERVYNVYGPTEYTTYATAALTLRGATADPPIGRPLCNTQAYVLDAQRQLLPIGVVGELHIAGHGLACGYLGQPELTAERFVRNPFGRSGSRMYRTGDLVRWSPDGQLEFIGRADQQIKLRGFRIELGEVEVSLRRHPAVRDAVVLACQDQPGNTQLTAYVVANDGLPSSAALREHLRGWLPDYMIPTAFVVLPAFPLTPSGKIDRGALPAAGLDKPVRSTEPDPGWMGWMQEMVADAFGHVLGIDQFGVGDDFFERGGHSLLAMEVAAHLEHLLAQPVSAAWIFQAPTPRELAPLIEASLAAPTSHITPLQPLGGRPALFCLHDLFNRAFHYASLAHVLAPDQPVYGVVPGPLEDAVIANPTFKVLTPAYVAAIKETQRRGPYRVVGFSFGGVLAFDVAQALLEAGEDVLLIMIDPYNYGSRPSMVQAAKWASRRSREVLIDIWAADQPVVPKIVETGRWTHRQSQRVIRKLREGRSDGAMSRDAVAARRVPDWISPAGRPLAASLLLAESTYQYRPYRGPTVFIQGTMRGALLGFLNADGLNGWGGMFEGPLRRIEIPVNHFQMMRPRLVAQVAEILRAL